MHFVDKVPGPIEKGSDLGVLTFSHSQPKVAIFMHQTISQCSTVVLTLL